MPIFFPYVSVLYTQTLYTFMPNIFHLLFHSLSVRWFADAVAYAYTQLISLLEIATIFEHHQKYLLPKFNTWTSATFTKPIDRAQNQFYSIQISCKNGERVKKKLIIFSTKKIKIKMTGMLNNVLCIMWVVAAITVVQKKIEW